MSKVYLIQHTYSMNENEETKSVGIYENRLVAENALEKLKILPGFRDYPNCFSIDEYIVNQNYWPSGFVTKK